MDFNTLLSLTLLIGAIAGWFAGQLVQGTASACLAIFSSVSLVRWLLFLV